eukprot:scaffold22528_cov30-Tisochrysis_lutea.AAC.1
MGCGAPSCPFLFLMAPTLTARASPHDVIIYTKCTNVAQRTLGRPRRDCVPCDQLGTSIVGREPVLVGICASYVVDVQNCSLAVVNPTATPEARTLKGFFFQNSSLVAAQVGAAGSRGGGVKGGP